MTSTKHIHRVDALQFRRANVLMKSALAAVAPSVTQLQQLRLLTQDVLAADAFDIAELVCRLHRHVSVVVPA